jgi:GT2 family glycosyltransferase
MRRPSPTLLGSAAIAPASRGAWNRIEVDVAGFAAMTLLFVTLHDAGGDKLEGDVFLDPLPPAAGGAGRAALVWYVPAEAVEARLMAFSLDDGEIRAGPLTLRRLARAAAAWRLLPHLPSGTLPALLRRTVARPAALVPGLRQALALAAIRALRPEQPYATWTAIFDRWADEAPGVEATGPSVSYLVFAHEERSPALAATLASLRTLQNDPAHVVLAGSAGAGALRRTVESLAGDYVGILQAGEVLPPHAGPVAAAQLEALGQPEIAIVDDDEIDSQGRRHSPRFKPLANHPLMLSGTLSRGLWLVRRETLLRHAPARAEWAEELRLATWLARHEAGAPRFSARIPFLLTRRRHDAETAPPEVLAEAVRRHLLRAGLPLAPEPGWPLGLRLADAAAGAEGRVTAIIPSTLRRPHCLECIRAVAEGTDHPGLDLQVVVMQPGPLDAQQREAAELLRREAGATVTHLPAARFNYATANNHIAARTDSEHILLLNDDVAPIRPDWLRWMGAFMADARTGIVGARLLYGDDSVQHGGVIMGLSGLCDHAHRHLPRDEGGYMFRAVLAQELSAVTGACLLVRRRLFEAVGGLDERYASAFNDVDFSLRVGETGHAIVYAPQAELHHFEMQTFTHHYEGERAASQAADVGRMRARWHGVCADDPFYSPNLSLSPGNDWNLAVPPRT